MQADLDLLRRLNGLRDADVEEIVWRKADRSLCLTVTRPASGVVTFVGIDGLAVETALFRGAFRMSGIEVDARPDALDVRVGFSEPASELRLRCRDVRITIGEPH